MEIGLFFKAKIYDDETYNNYFTDKLFVSEINHDYVEIGNAYFHADDYCVGCYNWDNCDILLGCEEKNDCEGNGNDLYVLIATTENKNFIDKFINIHLADDHNIQLLTVDYLEENGLDILNNMHEKLLDHLDMNDLVGPEMQGLYFDLIMNNSNEKKLNKLKSESLDLDEDNMEEKNMLGNFGAMMPNLEFGKVKGEKFKVSMNGLAFRNDEGKYLVYDIEDGSLVDVTGFTFDMDMIFQMPVSLKDVQKGDIICHKGNYLVVLEKVKNSLKCMSPFKGEEVTVTPTKSPFGFDFCTKVINMAEGMFSGIATDDSNPMTAMMPVMMMSEMINKGSSGGSSSNFMEIMMISQMMGGENNPFTSMFGTKKKTTAKAGTK